MMENEKKPSKKLKIIGNSIFFALIAVIVTFSVWNFVDIRSGYKYPIFGMRTSVIVSPSMAGRNDANTYLTDDMKQIQKYDVVTTVKYNNFDDIKLYDVATYFNGSRDLICHRVIDKYESEGKQYVVFRGDSNNVSDAPVSYELVRGKVISVTPKAGHFVAFVQSPYFFIAIFGTIFFVALGLFIINQSKEKKPVETPQNEGEVPEGPKEEPKDNPEEEKPEETPPEETPKDEEKEK